MEKVVGEHDLTLQQQFLIFRNSKCRIILLFNSKGPKLGPVDIFDALFLFLAFFKL